MDISYYKLNSNKFYTKQSIENFDNILIENIVAGNFSTNNTKKIGDQTSQSVSDVSQSNTTQNQSSQTVDNSVESYTTTQTNTNINASQQTNISNTTDQSSQMMIDSSTDTYNYDMSQVTNETTSSIENKMIQSCGATIEEAQSTINIVKDESINTNINNGNVFINTGDNVSISNVRLESELTFLGPSVDRSCMLDATNELQAELNAENDNSKSFLGGEGGDVSAEAGGNINAGTKANMSELKTFISDNDDEDQDEDDDEEDEDDAEDDDAEDDDAEDDDAEDDDEEDEKAGGISDKIILIIILLIIIYLFFN